MRPAVLWVLRALCFLQLGTADVLSRGAVQATAGPERIGGYPPMHRNLSCESCAWLRGASSRTTADTALLPPQVGLSFVHLRKAGGSVVLNLLRQWMKHRQCDDEDDHNRVWGWTRSFGVYEGVYRRAESRRPTPQTLVCQTLDIRHTEYPCLRARRVLSLPARAERRDVPFSLFTVIRDPIDRLISQAFYEGERSPHRLLVNRMRARCGHFQEEACGRPALQDACSCTRAVREETMAELKTNSTFWFRWYHHKQGFHERAMTNYYIKRLVGNYDSQSGASISDSVEAFRPAIRCLVHPLDECGFRGSLIDELGCAGECTKVLRNISEALELAKRVINEQLDFIIFERMHEDYSVHLLSRLLQEPSPDIVQAALKIEKNVGLHNTTRTGKAHLLPDDFVEFMRKENAADLELYEYAKRVFEARVRDEQWVYFRTAAGSASPRLRGHGSTEQKKTYQLL